jgi:hypothetical protein
LQSDLIQFPMHSLLDLRVVNHVEEGPHEAGRGRLHAGQEEIDHAVEKSVIT